MNIRRGLFRLWVIFAVLFASVTMTVAVWTFKEASAELADDLAWEHNPKNPYFGSVVADPPRPWVGLGVFTLTAFGVPLVILGLGRALVWAAEGFSDKRR